MSPVEPAQRIGERFLPKNEPIWPFTHDHRCGKNTHGVDPDRPFDDRIRFQHLQVLPIPGRRNCRRQHPASASAAQSGIEPHSPGDLGITAATWQHRKFLKAIGASEKQNMISISVVVAMVVILIGLVTFYGVLLKGPF